MAALCLHEAVESLQQASDNSQKMEVKTNLTAEAVLTIVFLVWNSSVDVSCCTSNDASWPTQPLAAEANGAESGASRSNGHAKRWDDVLGESKASPYAKRRSSLTCNMLAALQRAQSPLA
jgi:hypothetical protein